MARGACTMAESVVDIAGMGIHHQFREAKIRAHLIPPAITRRPSRSLKRLRRQSPFATPR